MSSPAPSAVRRAAGIRRRGSATALDMVLSLGLLMAIIGVFLLLLPRHHHDPVRSVDYSGQLQAFAGDAPFTVQAPQGLPAYWRVTSFSAVPPDVARQGTASLHMGFVVDRSPRSYAALEEANEPAGAVFSKLGLPPVNGAVQVSGQPWQLHRDEAGHSALSRTSDGLTVVVTDGGGKGGASLSQLEALAGSLQPQRR